MRSATTFDRRVSVTDVSAVRDLLVLWQHPQSRAIIPIGRLVRNASTYVFCYTRAAAGIEGFRPLPGLSDLHQSYESERMPSVFEQRVLEPDRPDYAAYLHSIGIEQSYATPWEQIVHSGGTRAGDTLQFMQVPTVSEGHARARFFANGVRHIPNTERTLRGRTVCVSREQQETALDKLQPGSRVLVETEEGNVEDPCAALITAEGVPVGYVPRCLSASIRELLVAGMVHLIVVRVGPAGSPPHLRLVLDLDLSAPSGFEFDRDGLWEPLPA